MTISVKTLLVVAATGAKIFLPLFKKITLLFDLFCLNNLFLFIVFMGFHFWQLNSFGYLVIYYVRTVIPNFNCTPCELEATFVWWGGGGLQWLYMPSHTKSNWILFSLFSSVLSTLLIFNDYGLDKASGSLSYDFRIFQIHVVSNFIKCLMWREISGP